jgi:hypothetical protein
MPSTPQDPLVILVGVPPVSESPAKEKVMDPALQAIMNQNMGQLAQSGIVAQNNFITVAKAQDLDYLEGKRLVSLDEAVGVREVQSQVNPGGPAPRA